MVDRGLEGRGVARDAAGFAATDFAATDFDAAGFAATGFAAAGFDAAGFAATDFDAAGFAATDFDAAGFAATDFDAAGFGSERRGAVVREADVRGVGDFRTRGVGSGGVIGGSRSPVEIEAAAASSGFSSGFESI